MLVLNMFIRIRVHLNVAKLLAKLTRSRLYFIILAIVMYNFVSIITFIVTIIIAIIIVIIIMLLTIFCCFYNAYD